MASIRRLGKTHAQTSRNRSLRNPVRQRFLKGLDNLGPVRGHGFVVGFIVVASLSGCLGPDAQPMDGLPADPAEPQGLLRKLGDRRVFATFPDDPGQPGGIVVDGTVAYVNSFGFMHRPVSTHESIFAYNTTNGQLMTDRPNPIRIPRIQPASNMGLSGMAMDGDGNLIVADMNARILRVDPHTGQYSVYGTFPWGAGGPVTTMPQDITFDAKGNLYITDITGTPIIWALPPGGGEAEPFFADPRLVGPNTAGLCGISVDPTGTLLYFTVCISTYPTTQGKGLLFTLPIANPVASELKLVKVFDDPAAGPLGIVFGESGRIYVALPGINQVCDLARDFKENARYQVSGTTNHLAFNGTSLLVPLWGQFMTGPWPIEEVFVDDTMVPEFRPRLPS